MAQRTTPRFVTLLAVTAAVVALVAPGATLRTAPARADVTGPGAVHLRASASHQVGSITAGSSVATYQYAIVAEDTGNPADSMAHCLPQVPASTGFTGQAGDPAFPSNCEWPSVRTTSAAMHVVAQGDQTDFATPTATIALDPGRYLVSVMADGYRLDGAHFTVTSGQTSAVDVAMDPLPVPLGTIRLHAFQDTAPVDGTYEIGVEQPLAGFSARIYDVLGEVTTDWYGNQLCSVYRKAGTTVDAPTPAGVDDPLYLDPDSGKPQVVATPGCRSSASGDIVIPYLGQNRYTANVTSPTGTTWFQTTTLEGNHDWDVWVQQGDTGYDTEQTVGQELQPAVDFGFVPPQSLTGTATGEVKGSVIKLLSYIPGTKGVPIPGIGVSGGKPAGPVKDALLSLSDLNDGDRMVYTGPAAKDGTFDIKSVRNGDYQLTIWDASQNMILNSTNVSVRDGKATDVGAQGLVDWWTDIHGSVFVDTNANGKKDPGEQGIPGFVVTVKGRDNTVLIEGGINTAVTDDSGNYDLREVYPLGKWLIVEAFNTRYETTGVTYQADNQPTETTLLGPGVDINVLPIIGLTGRLDWGVRPYARGTNGGIVGTVTYDSTRNELDPRFSATEGYQPGVAGLPVHLYAVKTDPVTGAPVLNEDGSHEIDPALELNDAYTSEEWAPSTGCVPRYVDGTVLDYPGQLALPNPSSGSARCVESPMNGVQISPNEVDRDTSGNQVSFAQTVNGNYGFGDSKRNLLTPAASNDPTDGNGAPLPQYAALHCNPALDTYMGADACPTSLGTYDYDNQALKAGDYLVKVGLDEVKDTLGRPVYQVTKEEDVNVFNGDAYLPQANFPYTGDPITADTTTGVDTQPPLQPPAQQANLPQWPPCVGAHHTVKVTNPAFLAGGGSTFEGQSTPLCDTKLVTVRNAQSVAPTFSVFTPVPLPVHFWGLVINDLALSNDPRSTSYGEAAPLPNVPVGFYDWRGRLDDTVQTDFNGFYEALEPSTGTYNCPLPAGPCPGMYRLVGNDPGSVGSLNASYNPRFRTIATNFQAWPGTYTATDLAPTQVAALTVSPGTSQATPVNCDLGSTTPQIFAVDRPWIRANTTAGARTITVKGTGFGASRGSVVLERTNQTADLTTANALTVSSWSDTSITFTVASKYSGTTTNVTNGVYTLGITSTNGQKTVNGLRVHLMPAGNANVNSVNPELIQVNPPGGFATSDAGSHTLTTTSVQAAINAAAPFLGNALVVVYPNPSTPRGEYYENVITSTALSLQGVGPGGQGSSWVPGSILDGRGFSADNDTGTAWLATLTGIGTHAGPADVPDAATITVLSKGGWSLSNHLTVDGFTVTGGTQNDVQGNLNVINNNAVTTRTTGAVTTQGGGIYVHAGATGLQISDNVIAGNSGTYGGGIRVGTPYTAAGSVAVRITRNRIRDNGGTNLAGGVGVFVGSSLYRVDHNDICGNFSAEYGGAVSHVGRMSGGAIDHNRIWFNQSYDEGGGVMVAGELPRTPGALSPGAGPVAIDSNLIQDNLANDDGGGVRFLMAGNFPMLVTNNMVINNISAHEGGGLALDDAPDVRLINNTVIGNITTATAITSNGQPAPAGLSTGANSTQLQAKLPLGSPTFSKPLLMNDIFWNNRAGSWDGATIHGIGLAGDASPVNPWDVGNVDPGLLTAYASMFQSATGLDGAGSNRFGVDPTVKQAFDTSVTVEQWRTYPAFRQAVVLAQNVPPTLMGDYHLSSTSPAVNTGLTSLTLGTATYPAPPTDIDDQARISPYDIGADELNP